MAQGEPRFPSEEEVLREIAARECGAAVGRGPDDGRSLAADSVEELDLVPVRRVFDAFFASTGLAMALVSPRGEALASSNWQPVCNRYFRAHPRPLAACEASDAATTQGIIDAIARGERPTTPVVYRCRQGLREIAQPLFIQGVHWATVYLGQCLFEGDEIDESALVAEAEDCGWDVGEFLEAYRGVPRVSREEVDRTLAFCVAFGDLVSQLNYSYFRERILSRRYLEADRSLTAALEQKDFLFAELQHRVKNSLTLIGSLLSLQSSSFEDGRARTAFEEAQGRIRSVALLYERLYATRSVSSIDLGAYVKEAAKAATSGLAGPDTPIELELDCEPIQIDTRRAIYVGLLVHEFATNALKHAFPGGCGRLRFALRAEGDTLVLQAADDGVGLPQGFSLERAGGSSMGSLVVVTLARQLDGGIACGPGLPGGAGPGAAFTLRFPL